MALFLTMFPFYLLGNLHCLGMCGPLVMMIGKHRYRYAYFFGRMLSFGMAGMAAGEVGAVLHGTLQGFFISEILTFTLAFLMFGVALANWKGWKPSWRMPLPLQRLSHSISLLMLKDTVPTTFWFGFLTVALPCGQTLIVFSACALAGDAWVGLFNGMAFALITSPSLWVAMHTLHWFRESKKHYHTLIIGVSIFAGMMAMCRGLADIGVIPHLFLGKADSFHLVLY